MKNTVYLPVGQRGAGKTTYCERLLEAHSDIRCISRDEVVTRLCGTVHLNPYTGGHEFSEYVFNRLVRQKLKVHTGSRFIFDYFTGGRKERVGLVRRWKSYGADRVVALYFITPIELVNIWFWEKPGIAKVSEMAANQGKNLSFYSNDAPKRDYVIFHNSASDIEEQGFDEVIRVHPLQPLVSL